MDVLKVTSSGNWLDTIGLLNDMSSFDIQTAITRIGEQGVAALRAATPVDTGLTANCWDYKVYKEGIGKTTIQWINTNVVDGYNIAVLLEYGHGTRSGKFVEGNDYINPALQPILEELIDDMWRGVTQDA